MACYRIQMCFVFSENLPKLTKTGLRHFGTATTICRQNKTISACGDVGLNRFHAIMGTYKRPCGDVGGGGKVQVVVLEECFRIWFGRGVFALRCGFVLVVGGCVVTSFCTYLDFACYRVVVSLTFTHISLYFYSCHYLLLRMLFIPYVYTEWKPGQKGD